MVAASKREAPYEEEEVAQILRIVFVGRSDLAARGGPCESGRVLILAMAAKVARRAKKEVVVKRSSAVRQRRRRREGAARQLGE